MQRKRRTSYFKMLQQQQKSQWFKKKQPTQLFSEVFQIFVLCAKIKSTFNLFFCLIILPFLLPLLLPSPFLVTTEIQGTIEEERKRKKPRQKSPNEKNLNISRLWPYSMSFTKQMTSEFFSHWFWTPVEMRHTEPLCKAVHPEGGTSTVQRWAPWEVGRA